MKILVGVDDSPFSRAAIEMMKRGPWNEAEFIVASAWAPIWPGPDQAIAADAVAELNRQQEAYHKETTHAAAKALTSAGLKATAKLLSGDPRHALLDEAKRERVDLIVVGSHGRSGMAKLLLGSVASHIVTHAPCSVLVVRSPA
ncbi:MAG TPA: universal stress protein [Candidatus Eisenbacteria bacterium]|jgi:nucleotide-binding universal stress UspA family protein|nr:universal stress protein [Candidatus Eisenbacteria bacterium]